MLATYMQHMHNNLEIRITGSSCRCAISKWNMSLNLNVKLIHLEKTCRERQPVLFGATGNNEPLSTISYLSVKNFNNNNRINIYNNQLLWEL